MSQAAAELVKQASLRIMAARILAQQRWPYISSLLFTLRLVPVTDGSLSTMAVDDRWRLYFAPDFVLEQEPEPLATVLIHEAMHCLNSHAHRYAALHQPPEHKVFWNFAADAAINSVLDDAKMPWPTVEPVRYRDLASFGVTEGMITESAFFALADYASRHPRQVEWVHDCGSGAGGSPRSYELPDDDGTYPAATRDHQDNIRDRVAHDIIQHAKSVGSVPAGLQRWAEELFSPRVPWREVLAGHVRRQISTVAGRRDYTYMRPSRRQQAVRASGSTILLPAMRQPAPPRVCVILDTSGSITSDELTLFLGEVVGITRAAGVSAPLDVICCDAEAYPVQRIRSRSDVSSLRLEGVGGTDMGVGMAAAAELSPRPHVVVVFTDGYTPWPQQQPRGIHATIVALSSPERLSDVPAWASAMLVPSA